MITVHSTPNGWHTATVEERSAATGMLRRYRITWRTNSFPGHLHDDVPEVNAERQPFYVDGSYAEVKDSPVQCATCGRLFVGDYTVHRMEV